MLDLVKDQLQWTLRFHQEAPENNTRFKVVYIYSIAMHVHVTGSHDNTRFY